MGATQEQRRKRFFGEHRAESLVRWLNKHPRSPEAKRLKGLVSDLRFLLLADGDTALRDEWERRLDGVRSQLAGYRLTPSLVSAERFPSRAKRTDGTVAKAIHFTFEDSHGSTAIYEVLRLAQDGQLWLIGCCQCGKWFVADRGWQYACSKSCRLRSREWKDHRAAWRRWSRAKKAGKTSLDFDAWFQEEARTRRKRGWRG